MNIEEAKNRLRLPDLCHKLGLRGKIPDRDGQAVSCLWPDRHANGDRNASLNFFDDLRRFKCFSCGIQGDGPDLIATALGIPDDEAFERFIAMAGGAAPSVIRSNTTKKRLTMPKLSPGSSSQRKALARLRRIDQEAVDLAVDLGFLGFGRICGCESWVLRDRSDRVAEARRLDGHHFDASNHVGARKSHTLAGSDKSWPLGIEPWHQSPDRFRKILVCEGGPDLLAALHFCLRQGVFDALPVAILGRNTSKLHPDSCDRFRGRHVRIFPHADSDGGGMRAARRWAGQIEESGAAEVDYFDFDGLLRADGKPVNDLNDCTNIHPDSESELINLIP